MLKMIQLIIEIEDRVCFTDGINALITLAQSNKEKAELFYNYNIHILVKNLLQKYQDIGLRCLLIQCLYFLLNISKVSVFEEIFDEDLIQVLTGVYNEPDCPKVVNGEVEILIKPYIINILGNISDKVDDASEAIINSGIFYAILEDMQACESQEIVSEAGYGAGSVITYCQDKVAVDIFIKQGEKVIMPIINVLKEKKYSSWAINPSLKLLRIILNYAVENGRFEIIQLFKQMDGPNLIDSRATSVNEEERMIAIDILNEHFRYESDEFNMDEYEYEGNYNF